MALVLFSFVRAALRRLRYCAKRGSSQVYKIAHNPGTQEARKLRETDKGDAGRRKEEIKRTRGRRLSVVCR